MEKSNFFRKSFLLVLLVMTQSVFAAVALPTDVPSALKNEKIPLKTELCVFSSKSNMPKCGEKESAILHKVLLGTISGEITPFESTTTGSLSDKNSEIESLRVSIKPLVQKKPAIIITKLGYIAHIPGNKTTYFIGSHELLLKPGTEQTIEIGKAEDLKYYLSLKITPDF